MSEDITLSIPFSKVDTARRIVTGYATAENVDPSGDLIEYSASEQAFRDWVGNIREMHAPKAVGKAISYRPVMVPYQGREYRGFEVDAYISKGAQDTWEKILDGTLKGFSVGGRIVKASEDIDKISKRTIRRIKQYELNELSLVDNMGNPAATVTMVKMASDGSLNYDLAKYKVFYCDRHGVARINESQCEHGDAMREIGSVDELDVDVIVKMVQTEIVKAAEGFVPPQGARTEARKGLEWRREFNRGGTAVGVARARDISNGKELSISTINRMVSYFARHEVDKKGQGWSPGEDGFPSAGRIAWALWGGDAGRTWANSIADRMNKVDMLSEIESIQDLEGDDFMEKEVAYGHKTPPKGFPENRSQYADPDNYKYPLDTAERVMAAFRYYNQSGQQSAGGYNDAQWTSIGKRIIAALNRLSETDYTMESGKIVRKNIGGDMDLQKNITDDTVESVQTLSENTKIGLIAKFVSWINGESDDITKSVDVTETVTAESVSSVAPAAPNVNIYINRQGDVEKSVEANAVEKAGKVCKDCGGTVKEGVDTCPNCGASMSKISKAMECPDCGCSVPEGEDTCPDCGCDMSNTMAEGNMKKSVESDETITDGEDNGGNEVDLEKLMEGIGTLLDEKISKIKEEVIETVDEKLAEITKSVDEKVETVSERVETVENAGAIKKSVDEEVVGDEEIIEKKAESFWGGIFVPAEIAEVLGYQS
jgi:RNA polymerase subunit RPABC4/transcription elongation factor Spt4